MDMLTKTDFQFALNQDIKSVCSISIVIPTKNEEGAIAQLIERIAIVCQKNNYRYEIIIIDDYSTDATEEIIRHLQRMFPISYYKKFGKTGKAQSLIEGFSYAKNSLLCMIDGDLQYPPEAIPSMILKLLEGNDIVVANRLEQNTSLSRQLVSKSFRYMIAKHIHGFSCDVQSGLKIFKKEIIERIPLHPTQWTFDLEFLSKARDAGYSIGSVPIEFGERIWGKSKVNVVKTSVEIGISAVKQKFSQPQVFPFHRNIKKKRGEGFHFKGKAFTPYTNLPLSETAFFRLSTVQKRILIVGFSLLILGFIINFHFVLTAIIALFITIYFIDLLFQLFLIIKSFSSNSEITIPNSEITDQSCVWPVYTILCPLYKESSVLPQFISAIEALNYPKDKLQVLLLLEEDDIETIKKVKTYALPPFIKMHLTPNSNPKTKPKALNYGLRFAKGEYLVVYDAEDVPDPFQLKKVVRAFEKVDQHTICIQAKLNFYNPFQNLLTRIFTAEYSLWFDLILTGLQSVKAPIPLGGTSNHFRTSDLHKLQGWDPFNVTEDCDLGIRLAKLGYHTMIINSTTFEEANSELSNWFAQRGRWIKGYMQTYLVHMRNITSFFQVQKKTDAIIFQLIIGGRVFSLLLNPFLWITTIIYFAYRSQTGTLIESFFPTPILYMGTTSFILGNFLYLYYYMIGSARREQYAIIKYAFFTPFYWLCMSLTAWLAVYKIILQPHYWAKTQHGLHLRKKKILRISEKIINKNLLQFPQVSVSQ